MENGCGIVFKVFALHCDPIRSPRKGKERGEVGRGSRNYKKPLYEALIAFNRQMSVEVSEG
jgi:hypothetical protein